MATTPYYQLKTNPMFRLSLSSLELFHSNFLAYLFECDRSVFMQCFGLSIPTKPYKIRREFCLGKINGKKVVTDIAVLDSDSEEPILIIENKIKSYPNENQLKEQSQLAPMAKKVLLSLFPVLPNVYQSTDFSFMSYSDLTNHISPYLSNDKASKPYVQDYIDYVRVISDEAYSYSITSYQDMEFFDVKNAKFLTSLGLDDAYLKYQASVFYYALISNLPGVVPKNGQYYYNNIPISFDCGFSNKKPIISIRLQWKDNHDAVVQIAGNVFRVTMDGKVLQKRNIWPDIVIESIMASDVVLDIQLALDQLIKSQKQIVGAF